MPVYGTGKRKKPMYLLSFIPMCNCPSLCLLENIEKHGLYLSDQAAISREVNFK